MAFLSIARTAWETRVCVRSYASTQPCFTHSLLHSITPSLNHSFPHSLLHSLLHSLTPSLTPSLTHSLTHSHWICVFGLAALHYAAANGLLDCAKFLVEKGCPYTANNSGNTPLHWAIQNRAVDIIKLLFKAYKNVDVLAKNDFGLLSQLTVSQVQAAAATMPH